MTKANVMEPHGGTHPSDHFVVLLDAPFRFDDGVVTATSPVRPALCAAGTDSIRPSLLLSMLDYMAGEVTGRAAGPTVDIRLQMLRPSAAPGRLDLVVRPLRIGRRIVVSEGVVSDSSGQEVARAITTFMNTPMLRWLIGAPTTMAEPTFDEMLRTRVRDERTLEVVPGARLVHPDDTGLMSGGVQSLFAELCAQHAFGGGAPMVAVDIDVRFLSGVAEWPMVARAERLAEDRGAVRCQVALTDATGEHLATHVALTMVPAS